MYNWQLQPYPFNQAKLTYLARSFNVDPFLIQLLATRGIRSGNALSKFFFPTIDDFHDPFLLNDMKKAVSRTIRAIKNQETIVIFGDFDADGITSTAILFTLLHHFQGNVSFEIPLRDQGYGITIDAVERIKQKHRPSLIITVDNGSNAHEAIAKAHALGIDVIVTDHHDILAEHPPCYAFINPKRSDSTYPFDGLSGAGVALKFAQALFSTSRFDWQDHVHLFIELAAIGTIADVMELTGENRTIASLGLKKLNHNPAPFFKELYHQRKIRTVTSETIGFTIAPIFNSIGRISDANTIIPFLTLTVPSPLTMQSFIQLNEERKGLTLTQTKLAEALIYERNLHKKAIIVVSGPFHPGIVGIIAARIVNKFKKPAIVLTLSGKGSARSFGDFSIVEAIRKTKTHVETFGGHKAAAGLSIDPSKLEAFTNAIQQTVQLVQLTPVTAIFHAEIPITHFPVHLVDELRLLEPYGVGNLAPLFYSPRTTIDQMEFFGKTEKHIKFHSQNNQVIAFGKGEQCLNLPSHFTMDFLYSLQTKNRFLVHDFSLCETFPEARSV